MIYVDEAFYQSKYLTGRKPVINSGFLYYAKQASHVIDQYTFNRLNNIQAGQIPETVKMCCCELAETLYRMEKREQASDGKTAERIGTYSVNFESTSDLFGTFARNQKETIMKWLADTGLCYQGVG